MISAKTIEKAAFDLCIEANTVLCDSVFEKIQSAYKNEKNIDAKQALQLILNNAKLSYEKKMPLCQDTGVVLIFLKIGNHVKLEKVQTPINAGVQKAYEQYYFRKSIVKDGFFDRTNTKTNLPVVIYPEFVEGNSLEIELLVKGGGAENMSATAMLSPTANEDDIVNFVVNTVKKAGSKPCPPIFLGLGIGGTMDYAAILSKKALLLDKNIDEAHENLAKRIEKEVNALEIGAAGYGGNSTALDVKIMSDFAHIASMPVALTVNCHSSRHAKCVIKDEIGENDKIITVEQNKIKNYKAGAEDFSDFIRVNASDISAMKKLKTGDKVLISGEIYTARDAAHKRLVSMIEKGEKLPFELKNSIIFYAGPCPCKESEVIGSVGPTTSSRMDKFAPILYEKGVFATIGKGERSIELQTTVKKVGGLYFTVIGGIACLLSGKVLKKTTIAFEDLGTEAICKLEVRDLPVKVCYS